LPQNPRNVPLSVKDSENPNGIAPGLIDNEIGENSVEKNLTARKIGASMTAIRNFGDLVKALKEFRNDSIRCLYALLSQEVEPDGVDIKDGILGKLKGVQTFRLDFRQVRFS
jgi:hypothetical protein